MNDNLYKEAHAEVDRILDREEEYSPTLPYWEKTRELVTNAQGRGVVFLILIVIYYILSTSLPFMWYRYQLSSSERKLDTIQKYIGEKKQVEENIKCFKKQIMRISSGKPTEYNYCSKK